MNKFYIKKWVAFLLAILMIVSAPSVRSFAEATELTDLEETEKTEETESFETLEESETDFETDDSFGIIETESESEESETKETDFSDNESELQESESETESEEESETESETETETESETEEPETGIKYEIVFEENLKLTYGDYYSLTKDYEGYQIFKMRNQKATSHQVKDGRVLLERDKKVVVLEDKSKTDFYTTGCGTCSLILLKTTDIEGLAASQEESELVPDKDPDTKQKPYEAIELKVSVSPARLTMMYLGGQSNMEGKISGGSSYSPLNSVACPKGTVYSTYLPKSTETASIVTGKAGIKPATIDNYRSFIAGNLGSAATKALDKSTLQYDLYSLTEKGDGKLGVDSGLAFEWNRLTGDKVWVVNAGAAGTSILGWSQGGKWYDRALKAYQTANLVADAEILAGHYTKGKRIMFWMQGEYNRFDSAGYYESRFKSLYKGMTNGLLLNAMGIIMIRASKKDHYQDAGDLMMNGPRIAQYKMINSNAYPKLYLATNANEKWVTDAKVVQYFTKTYPNGKLTYPIHYGGSYVKMATTVRQLRADVHFSQRGHNENGVDAARNIYRILKGTDAAGIRWYDKSGPIGDKVIKASAGNLIVAQANIQPAAYAKTLTIKVDPKYLKYDEDSGKYKALNIGTTTIKMLDPAGKVVTSQKIQIAEREAPDHLDIAYCDEGLRISWNKLSGISKYRVYKLSSSGTWTKITDVTGGSYIYESVQDGSKYTFTVRGLSDNGKYCISKYDKKGRAITYKTPVQITEINRSGSKATLSWQKTGAARYHVYYRTEKGSWQKAGATTKTTYELKGLSSDKTYFFEVVPLNADNKEKYSITYMDGMRDALPLTGLKNTSEGVSLSWKKQIEATGYEVFAKSAQGNWEKIMTTTDTSCKFTKLTSGARYAFTVRAMKDKHPISMSDKIGKELLVIHTPVLYEITRAGGVVKLRWKPVTGVNGYQILRKIDNGDWVQIAVLGNPNIAEFMDGGAAANGKKYTYSVRAYIGPETGDFDHNGLSIK